LFIQQHRPQRARVFNAEVAIITVGYRTYDYLAFYKIGCRTRVNEYCQFAYFSDTHLPVTHNSRTPFVTIFFKSPERRGIWFSGLLF
jgi:hypothetical protein